MREERSAQGHPAGSADKMPQGPAPTAPTTQAGGPQQAPPSQQYKQRPPGSTRMQ